MSGTVGTALTELEGGGGGEVELDSQNGKEILSFKQIFILNNSLSCHDLDKETPRQSHIELNGKEILSFEHIFF